MPPAVAGRRVAVIARPTDRAVVLGSTQQRGEIDEAAVERRGVSLVQRRSGGGAVVVAPGAQVWVDLFVPRADPIFDEDVRRAAFFVGDLWAAAISLIGTSGTPVVPIRSFQPTRWSRRVCYSGLGPGEVTVGGRKVVGVSQRRDRSGAWFFTMALLDDTQAALAELLALDAADREALKGDLGKHSGRLEGRAEDLEALIVEGLAGG